MGQSVCPTYLSLMSLFLNKELLVAMPTACAEIMKNISHAAILHINIAQNLTVKCANALISCQKRNGV